MGIRVFTSKIIREGIKESELQSLVSKFKQYKESGDTQNYFGRDVSFNRPESVKSAGLMHVHTNDGRPWGVRLLQFDRISDTHIVYCQGYFQQDCYLLITLVKGAHARYRDNLFMLNLADIASDFRDKY